MKKIISLSGVVLGSYLGWWLGGKAGLMAAVICGSCGAGVGLYIARRFTKNLLE